MKIYPTYHLKKIASIATAFILVAILSNIPVQALHQADSLKEMLHAAKVDNKDELFNRLSSLYLEKENYDSANYYATEALELAKEQHDYYNFRPRDLKHYILPVFAS